jgi:4-alpha-glucanotransferase
MPVDSYQDSDFEERLQSYMVKVLREGKVHSDWSEPNMDYEINTHSFIHSILADSSEFRKSLNPFLEKAAYLGILNSMSEVLLKCTAPGVPDFYQGSESWNFNFVDPDNRRPVDFDNLEKELAYLKKENCRISDMFSISRYSSLKLLLTNILLEQRCSNHNVYEKGEYIPLIIKGRFKDMLLAYARRYNETVIILAVPLHPGEFFDNKRIAEMQAINWKDTRIDIPDFFPDEYKNLLTGRTLKVDKNISLSVLFSEIPFGLLKAHQKISERKAGILLHISSLPGKYTTGDVGPEAYRFVDFLKLNGQSYWQILPLNQTDVQYDHSPYSPLSAFAGNKCFISIDLLAEQNLISGLPENTMLATSGKADYQKSLHIKEKIIDIAYKRFKNGLLPSLTKDFAMFQEKEKYWLKDYSLFITLREKFHFSKWNEWPVLFRDHDVKTLERFSEENQYSIEKEEFSQFLFQQQWQKLKSYCNDRNIRIFGDIPIYINYDSADVWAHPEFFILKRNKDVKYVAGVPPDYFSEKGQLWNMPVFRWNKMRKDGYTWWKERLRKNLNLYDLLRLDHFRGFSAYWQVPAGEANAVNGKWVRGPGNVFFDELKKVFPDMPFVAEDLGQIDQQVYRLRDEYDLPGMRVLQFAFGEDCRDCVHFLHNHTYNSIVYTGTHDNNTIRGWFKNETGPYHRKNLKKYLGRRINYCNCHTELIRLAYSSVAKLVIIPFQDILGLGSDARMNTPSVGSGNWLWRLAADDLKPKTGNKIKELVQTFGRI